MRAKLKHVAILCATLSCFVVLKYATNVLVLSSFFYVTIDAEMDHDDKVEVFGSPNLKYHSFELQGAEHYTANFREEKKIQTNNRIARQFRLDLGEKPGMVRLHKVTFFSYFGDSIEYTGPEILKNFVTNEYITSAQVEGSSLLLQVDGYDQYITHTGPLQVGNFFIGWIMPLVHAFIFYLFLTKFKFRNFPAFTDITRKVSSSGTNYGALDGMRGLAALTVLGEHSGVFKGTGWLGILWFFTLSGFLLSLPFVQDPKRILSYNYMSNYMARRLKRVMPMFYVMITMLFLFRGRIVEAFRHYYFVQADGVLWTVPQELFFYFWLPFIMLAIYFFFAGKKIPAILFLLSLMAVSFLYLTNEVISLYGQGVKGAPRIGAFLCGSMFAYITVLVLAAIKKNGSIFVAPSVFSTAGLLLYFLLIMLAANDLLAPYGFNPAQFPGIFSFLSGTLILFAVCAGSSRFSAVVGCLPLRAMGLVSFSFYLLHPLVIDIVKSVNRVLFNQVHLSGYAMFVLAGILTYIFATITYTYIERPFIR
ncbi:MAG: acyltransferase [bacterium]|nr:acyltransferase [bacterium]